LAPFAAGGWSCGPHITGPVPPVPLELPVPPVPDGLPPDGLAHPAGAPAATATISSAVARESESESEGER
jgi:hypothetical protein